MFKLDLEKAEEPEIRWVIKKAREFQKNIYFCFIDYAKAFDCVDHPVVMYGCESWTIKKAERQRIDAF